MSDDPDAKNENVSANRSPIRRLLEGWNWSVAPVFISFCALFVSIYQSYIASDNEVRSLRSYLYIVDQPINNASINLGANQRAMWHVKYLNFGKTAAEGIVNNSSVFFGPDALQRAEKFALSLPTRRPVSERHSFLPPVGSNDDGLFTSVTSEAILTDFDIPMIINNDANLVVVGRVWYNDVFSNERSTDYCLFLLATRAHARCDKFNDIR